MKMQLWDLKHVVTNTRANTLQNFSFLVHFLSN